jgi:hypothetical protein
MITSLSGQETRSQDGDVTKHQVKRTFFEENYQLIYEWPRDGDTRWTPRPGSRGTGDIHLHHSHKSARRAQTQSGT